MKRAGFTWDTNKNVLLKDGSEFCRLMDVEDQFIIKHHPLSKEDIQLTKLTAFTAAEKKKKNYPKLSALPKKSEASGEVWHARISHPGPDVIKHLETATEGTIIKGPGPLTTECKAYSLSKSKQIILRRPPEYPATEPFE